MLRHRVLAFVLFLAAFLLLWNVLNYLYALLISRGGYSFMVGGDLIAPLVVASVMGYLLILRNGKD